MEIVRKIPFVGGVLFLTAVGCMDIKIGVELPIEGTSQKATTAKDEDSFHHAW
ncbi:MAG: hypothetical protein HN795_00830 [Flavobacteriaceae bacterium]|nr:hypothetical protein [Flavobacteriaceae bacterium]